MKKYIPIIAIFFVVCAGAAWAIFLDENAYENCILENMKGVKTNFSADIISRACRNITAAKLQVPQQQLATDQCVLDNLTGDEGDTAIQKIIDACTSLNKY